MQIKFVILCLIAHIIGEYYLQDDKMADLKRGSIIVVLKHSLLYSIPFAVIYILFEKSWKLKSILLLLCLVHFIIEFVRWLINIIYEKIFTAGLRNKVEGYIKPWMIYILIQVINIMSIIILVYWFRENIYKPIEIINTIYSILNIDKLMFLRWGLMILCIHKPANTTFRIIFADCKPSTNSVPANNTSNNGAKIGFLERIIIALFIYIQQYSAIGFILTAKSIARYNKISEDAEFGEYYLIGTLFSTLFVIVMYNIIFLS